jgi:hypothetical protein
LPNGRYAVQPHDRLLRVLNVIDEAVPGGLREVATRDSRQATVISAYWRAVDLYVSKGVATSLPAFEGRMVIDAEGHRIPLVTDRATLERLANAGVLSFESIYARST